jgi:hypothetical protein
MIHPVVAYSGCSLNLHTFEEFSVYCTHTTNNWSRVTQAFWLGTFEKFVTHHAGFAVAMSDVMLFGRLPVAV